MNNKQIYSIAISSVLGTSIGTAIGAILDDVAMGTVYGMLAVLF